MRFSIIGAGALGTILGACLLEAGHEVRLLARGQRAAHIAKSGLRVNGIRELEVACTPVTQLDPNADNGVLVYAVKTYHMRDALPAPGAIKPRAAFSLANGVMKKEQLEHAFGRARVLGCMANFSGELRDDGTVNFTRNVCLHLGGDEPMTSEIVRAINDSGIVTVTSAAIETVEWSKFVGWVALFSLSVIARTTTGVFLANAQLAEIAVAMIREAAAVAAARKIKLLDLSPLPIDSVVNLPLAEAIEKVRDVGLEMQKNAPDHRMSSLQDLESGRMLEVHETVGYVVREAQRLKLDAPTVALAYRIASGLNALPR